MIDAFRSIATGTTLHIRSDDTFKRDYVYIGDIVDAYILIAEKTASKKLAGQAFNIGNNKPLKVIDVLTHIKRIEPRLRYKILNTAKNEIKDQYLNSHKAAKLLRWNPKTTFQEGLARTTSWYSDFLT